MKMHLECLEKKRGVWLGPPSEVGGERGRGMAELGQISEGLQGPRTEWGFIPLTMGKGWKVLGKGLA